MYTVYEHVNKINKKRYIGITSQNPQQRWGCNGCNYKSSPRFYYAIQKYGWDNFEHNILFQNLTKEEACKKEQELIKFYQTISREFGYNLTSGGEIFIMNQETKDKISKAMIGNKNGLGHPCSEEKKKKISESQKGRKFTEEHKYKLSLSAKNRNTPCSEEKKKKLSENYPYKRKVYCEELDIVFDSVQQCGKYLNISPSWISKICKGERKSAKGYHFKYFEENNNTINA